ncbi:hypothetical protein ACWDLG_41290 [Nonomuraea sp. NPDC003727]
MTIHSHVEDRWGRTRQRTSGDKEVTMNSGPLLPANPCDNEQGRQPHPAGSGHALTAHVPAGLWSFPGDQLPLMSVRSASAEPPGAGRAAEILQRHLAAHGIAADVHDGGQVSLLSLWRDLLVWTNGRWFSWWTGKHSTAHPARKLYAFAPADDAETAARRLGERYRQLRASEAAQ